MCWTCTAHFGNMTPPQVAKTPSFPGKLQKKQLDSL